MEMKTLADHLTAHQVQPQVIAAVARNLALARIGFPPDEEIWRRLKEVPHPEHVGRDVDCLSMDANLRLQTALDILSVAWQTDRHAVEAQLRETQEALSTVPWVAIPASLLLGYWIMTTNGETHKVTRISVQPDGTYEQVQTLDRAPFRIEFKSIGIDLSIGPQSEVRKGDSEVDKPQSDAAPRIGAKKAGPHTTGPETRKAPAKHKQKGRSPPSKSQVKGKAAKTHAPTACTPKPAHKPRGRKR